MTLPTKDDIARIIRDDPEAEFIPGNDSFDIVIKMNGHYEITLNAFLFDASNVWRIEKDLSALGVSFSLLVG